VARAFVGLGSNLGDRAASLRRAVGELAALRATEVSAVSSLRDTEPVGLADQPRFLNGVAELETSLPSRELMVELLRIERSLGRDRAGVPPGGPRTIDLDLLVYGDERLQGPDLELPHPRLHERRFVLEPLAELDRTLEVPGKGTVQTLLAKLDSSR
jgi:2-amino-4-hydroxy-6-hydroxymethyldihydropteridine diphosphokinase